MVDVGRGRIRIVRRVATAPRPNGVPLAPPLSWLSQAGFHTLIDEGVATVRGQRDKASEWKRWRRDACFPPAMNYL